MNGQAALSSGHGMAGKAAPFLLAGLAAVFLAVPTAWWLASAPAAPGQYERLGAEIGCQCGTCPNRPIATCGCGFADRMLGQLRDEVSRGRSDEAILASFESSYGPAIRIKPASSGIDLAAWLAPMMLLLGGAVAVSAVLAHWREQTGSARPGGGAAGPAASDDDADGAAGTASAASARTSEVEDARYRAIVDRELGDLPD